MPRGVRISAQLVGRKGGVLDEKKFLRRVSRTNQRFAKRAKRSFRRSTRTWDHAVKFHQKTNRQDLTVEVFTTDQIYFWISEGTSIRYATMTPDFVAKTRPGALDSGPGAGGVAFVTRARPNPGIEARQFDRLVVERHQDDYQHALDRDLAAAEER